MVFQGAMPFTSMMIPAVLVQNHTIHTICHTRAPGHKKSSNIPSSPHRTRDATCAKKQKRLVGGGHQLPLAALHLSLLRFSGSLLFLGVLTWGEI